MAEILHAAATLFSSPLELSSTQQSSSVLQRHFPVSDITAAKISDVCLKIALNLFRIFITVFPPHNTFTALSRLDCNSSKGPLRICCCFQ